MGSNPLNSNLAAPLPPPMKQPSSRTAADRSMYLPSDQASRSSQVLPRGADRASGMYLPSDERRAVAPTRAAAERGMSALPYDEGRPQLLPRGSDQLDHLLLPSDNRRAAPLLPSRGSEQLGMHLPSDNHYFHEGGMPLLPRGAHTQRGGIFLTSDDHSLARQVEQLHSPDASNVDVRPLFLLVQEIIERAPQTIEGASLGSAVSMREAIEGKYSQNFLQEIPELPLTVGKISCEIACKVLNGVDEHYATLSVLNMLQHYSWEAKVVLTLAAFALLYGDFWLLVQIYSSNALAKSMALIKRLPMFVEHAGGFKHQFEATNNLIKAMLEIAKCILDFGELPTEYITAEDPEVKAAISHFPIAVYWIIRSAVAAATQITFMSTRGIEKVTATSQSWELSNWAHKLNNISTHLRETLSRLLQLIREKKEADYYLWIRKVVYEMIHVDNQKVLNVLINPKDDVPPLYDGPSKRRVHLEVLRGKHVLLLISGLEIIEEELFVLEQSYTESKVHAYEIVWVPVVDSSVQWTESMQSRLETLQASMPWYCVHHPTMIGNAVKKFFRVDWHFRGRPILVLLDPLGREVSQNVIHMMWIWQSKAFPFTRDREEDLWDHASYNLDLLINAIDPKIMDWIQQDKYILLYGGDDIELIRRLTREAHAVSQFLQVEVEMVYVGRSHNKEQVRKVVEAIIFEKLSHYWQEPSQMWYFWTRIESMLYSTLKVLERVPDHRVHTILQEMQRLHNYDKSQGGWAILAKGSIIVAHGEGKLVLRVLEEREMWKDVAVREGFHKGFKVHLDGLLGKHHRCHRIDIPKTVKPPRALHCPDCSRQMPVYNTFICCHEDGMLGQDSFVPARVYDDIEA